MKIHKNLKHIIKDKMLLTLNQNILKKEKEVKEKRENLKE